MATERLVVVVVSADAAFRRLAGAALSRAGHEVHTAAETPQRVDRLVSLRRPQVLVLDVSAGGVPPKANGDGPAVVLVADNGMPATLQKWGPLDGLVSMIEGAAHRRPRLQVVRSKT